MVPSAKGILTVDDITLLEVHSPLKILGPGLIRCNIKGTLIRIDSFFMQIIQILNFNIGLIDGEYFAPAPDELIILAIGLDDINIIILFESSGKTKIGYLIKVVVWLSNKRITYSL